MPLKKSSVLLETKDFRGFVVYLSKETWLEKLMHPVFGHPEVKPYLNEIRSVVSSPDVVYQSQRDSRSKLFYKPRVGRRVTLQI